MWARDWAHNVVWNMIPFFALAFWIKYGYQTTQLTMVSPKFRNICDMDETRIMSKRMLTTPLILIIITRVMMVDWVRLWRSILYGFPQTSKTIWGLDYRMHPIAWNIVMLDWNSNAKNLRSWTSWFKNISVARIKGFNNTQFSRSLWCKVLGLLFQQNNWPYFICQIFSWDLAKQERWNYLCWERTTIMMFRNYGRQ